MSSFYSNPKRENDEHALPDVAVKTHLGYTVHVIHPMAHTGSRYRFTTVSGTVHVDEYVGSCGVWVYMGWVTK